LAHHLNHRAQVSFGLFTVVDIVDEMAQLLSRVSHGWAKEQLSGQLTARRSALWDSGTTYDRTD
jgi:hypothetical protein